MQWPPRPGPGIEGHEAERLGLGRVDHFPDVDVHPVAHQRQLVDQADVHRAERVLEQLHHLGDAGRADRHDGLDRGAVERGRELRAVRGEAADHLRDVVGLERRVARIDALGREREEEVDAGLEPGRFEQRLHHFVGRARIGRRLEDDQHARVQVLGDRLDRRDDVGHVGVLGLAQRRRHADVDRVELARRWRSRWSRRACPPRAAPGRRRSRRRGCRSALP